MKKKFYWKKGENVSLFKAWASIQKKIHQEECKEKWVGEEI